MKQPEAHHNSKLTCATCKWIKKPYRGRTCKERYGIDKYCRACVEYEPQKEPSDIDKIKADPFFIKIRKRIQNEEACQIDANIEDEILGLQKASVATLRSFTHTFVEMNKDMIKLSKLFAKTQANRERINEISIEMTYLLNNYLYPMQKLARSKIFTDYAEVINNYRSAEDKNTIISSVIVSLEKRINRAENILEVAELAVKNLDQNYWNLKSIKEIGEGICERRATDASIMRR